MAKTTVALLYDFDKTLCTTDMQEYDFIKNLNLTPAEFWGETSEYTEKYEMDKILSYMYMMIKKCKEKGVKLTSDYLRECGKNVVLYKGVTTWFDRINEYGKSLDLNIEHYIISSGITEIIEGTPIAKYFKKIYGCKFLYDDETKEAIWPALSINYTLKTQYLFRISKGVLDVTNDDDLNNHQHDSLRRVDYKNMIYFGDGITDIPCMKLLKEKGGKSIAVYKPGKGDKVLKLVQDSRINYVAIADYSQDSALEKMVKMNLEKIAIMKQLEEKEDRQVKQFLRVNDNEN